MLLILVLQELTELAKGLLTITTLIWEVWNRIVLVASIGQHGHLRHKMAHLGLLRSKFVNLLPGIVTATTTTARPSFNVLNSVGSRTKPTVTTNRTGDISRSMNLLMHFQLILIVELTVTNYTLVHRCPHWCVRIHTVGASRVTIAFHPLVSTKVGPVQVAIARAARSTHSLVDSKG